MNIDNLKILNKVAQVGSFAAAARSLNVDPSSISRTISTLEQQLGLRLFQRTTRQLLLTEAGEIYLNRISALLDEFDFALEEANKVSNVPSGTLRVSASVAFGQVCLLPHINEFKKRYPEITLELQFTDTVVDMVENGIDLSCRLAPSFDSQLIGTRLFTTQYRVCVSPEYFNSMSAVQVPKDLEAHQCIVFTLPEYRSRWLFKNKQQHIAEINIKSSLSISSALALRECALSGMGPALLADWLVDADIKAGRLIPLLTDFEVTAENFDTAAWLLYPSRHFLATKTRVMIDFLKSKYSNM